MKTIVNSIALLVLSLNFGLADDAIKPISDILQPTEIEQSASFDRKIQVFGIRVLAMPDVTSRDLTLCANILAQWIDNDEDGVPDNSIVLDEILKRNSYMVLGVSGKQIGAWHENSQDVMGDGEPAYGLDVSSINHNWYRLQPSEYSQDHYRTDGLFPPDGGSEETFHLITDLGYGNAYPKVFGRGGEDGKDERSILTLAMDNARGGFFPRERSLYPKGAWYTRKDPCSYQCFVGEYIHWGMITLLGFNKERGDAIQDQWSITDADALKKRDPALYELLTNPEYRFPKIAPDGTYSGFEQGGADNGGQLK